MAEIANTAWYRIGTVSIANESTIVTGVGTNWLTAGINPGATLRIEGYIPAYEVKCVNSDTEIELARPYHGTGISGAQYSIDRNFQATTNAKLAADVTDLVRLYEQVRDGTTLTIEGRSAYQIAVANGFAGTEAEWLESLKGAGDYSALLNVVEPITYHTASAHNSIYRGKYLGTEITDAMHSTIKNTTYKDLYPGDYFQFSVNGSTVTAYIARMGYATANGTWGCSMTLWLYNKIWNAPINDTNTCEGHLLNSKLYTETFPEILEAMQSVINPDWILASHCPIADSINAEGFVNHHSWQETNKCSIFLPSVFNLGFPTEVPLDTLAKNEAYMGFGYNYWPFARHYQWHNFGSFWLSANSDATHWMAFESRLSRRAVVANPSSSLWVMPYIIIR